MATGILAKRPALRPAVPTAKSFGNPAKTLRIQDGPFAAHVGRGDLQDAVQLHFGGPALRIPGPRAKVDVVIVAAVLAAVVLAGEHDGKEAAAAAPHHQHRPVLAWL
ncbi:hypothetical protein QMG52_20460 [Paenarthrobacter sp. PH39-S1]|nr:hypothetical protein [Paenarthrobacter sp. PH39-S1]MDJ0358389.1 hypothetical protein [Paenarthrobacter sp. PH39-S1]